MTFIDDKTAVLKDSSIVVFNEIGGVYLYSSKEWKKPKKGNCHSFDFITKEQAINVFRRIDENLL